MLRRSLRRAIPLAGVSAAVLTTSIARRPSRVVGSCALFAPSVRPYVAEVIQRRHAASSIPTTVRDDITRSVSGIRDEAKGQALDLADMAESARSAHSLLATTAKTHAAVDPAIVSRLQSLSVGMKAYAARLSTLQAEAKKLNVDAESLVKVLWGTEKPTPVAAPAADFEADPPPIARRLEEINNSGASGSSATRTPVESVEGEVVRDATPGSTSSGDAAAPSEIEVEAIELEQPKAAAPEPDDVDEMSVSQLTQALHDKNVDFSDCRDGRTLRQRYRDFLAGKVGPKATQPPPPPRSTSAPSTRPAPPQQQQQQQAPPNSSETGLAVDPYPGAHRKMIDPMKYVHEVKADLAVEHRVDPRSIDLWSGMEKLEDHKRLYEYPGLQHNPIEVRNKGDPPKGGKA